MSANLDPAANGAAMVGNVKEAAKATADQAQTMMNATTENLAIWQRIGAVWLQNRTNDFSDAAAAAQRLSGCTSADEFMQAYSEWVNARIQRLGEEAGTYQDCLKTISVHSEKVIENVGNQAVATADTFAKKSKDALTQ